MANPTVQPLYAGTIVTATITLASLASSSTFTVGRQSTAFTNTANLYDDVKISGLITVGTTPTINTQIIVYAFEALDLTPTFPDTFGTTDAGVTITSAGVGAGYLKWLCTLAVDSVTSNRGYPFSGISVAQAFGGNLPRDWGYWVTHNTAVTLNATAGNHYVKHEGINYILPTV